MTNLENAEVLVDIFILRVIFTLKLAYQLHESKIYFILLKQI